MMIYPYLKPAKECGCKTILHCREHWPLDEHTTQLKWARNAVYQYADKLIAINNYSASIFPEKQATIVYDWIDMDSRYEYRPMSEILGEDATDLRIYLYTGGVQRTKGALEVLRAFSECIKDPNTRLLAIGIDLENTKNNAKIKFKSFLASIGIRSYYFQIREIILADSRIHCIPATYMLSHIMQQCYCNLSYFTIPHANLTLAECAIMGIPSIAANNEEAQEYSHNGTLSYLFCANSQKSFYNAILTLDTVYQNIKSQLSTKQQELKAKFSKEKNIAIFNQIIQDTL